MVLPRELLGHWNGSDGEPISDDFPFGPDYTRACKAAYPVDLLEVGPGFGLIIGTGEQVESAAWIELSQNGEIVLVGWSFGVELSEPNTEVMLSSGKLQWQRVPRRIHLASGELVLFHPACTGTENQECDPFGRGYAVITDAIPFRAQPGDYFLEFAEVSEEMDEEIGGSVICRWVKEIPKAE